MSADTEMRLENEDSIQSQNTETFSCLEAETQESVCSNTGKLSKEEASVETLISSKTHTPVETEAITHLKEKKNTHIGVETRANQSIVSSEVETRLEMKARTEAKDSSNMELASEISASTETFLNAKSHPNVAYRYIADIRTNTYSHEQAEESAKPEGSIQTDATTERDQGMKSALENQRKKRILLNKLLSQREQKRKRRGKAWSSVYKDKHISETNSKDNNKDD